MKPNKDNLIDFRGGWPQGTFVPLSKQSLTWGLTPVAVLAYGVLMNRAELSFRNGWLDERDLPFVIYPLDDLGADLGVSESTARRVLRELTAGAPGSKTGHKTSTARRVLRELTDLGLVSRRDIPGKYTLFFLKTLPEEPEEPDSRFHLWYPSPLKLAGEVLPNWRRTPAESGPEL